MKKTKIGSTFDREVVNVLKQLVPDQKMRLIGAEGEIWESVCKDADGMAITYISKNSEIVAKIVYDYDTGREEEFLVEEE